MSRLLVKDELDFCVCVILYDKNFSLLNLMVHDGNTFAYIKNAVYKKARKYVSN